MPKQSFQYPKQSEHEEQAALIQWANMSTGAYPELGLLFSVPNGGKRHISVARRMRQEGVRKGIPDLMLPVARGQWHGLFLEMKVKPNTPSDEQQAMLEALNEQGYATAVCYSFEDARDTVLGYLRDGLMEGK